MIVSDLKIAETNLSDMTSDSSRPNIWTAKSLLAKVYLAMAGFPLNKKQYTVLAKDKAYEIIKAEVYSLEKNFSQLWIWDNRKSNSEFIFTLYASSDNGLGSYLHQAVRPVDGGENGWGDWTGDKLFLQTSFSDTLSSWIAKSFISTSIALRYPEPASSKYEFCSASNDC